MWLEAMSWLWGPVVCAFGAWTVWRNVTGSRELRELRGRIAELESRNESSPRRRRAA